MSYGICISESLGVSIYSRGSVGILGGGGVFYVILMIRISGLLCSISSFTYISNGGSKLGQYNQLISKLGPFLCGEGIIARHS